MIALTLPWPPSVNQHWRRGRGRTYASKRSKDYARNVWAVVLELNPPRPLTGRLRVTIELYPPDRRRYDLDNVCKVLLDSLAAARIMVDDEQVDELLLYRRDVRPGAGGCTVWIQEIGQETDATNPSD